MLRLDCRCQCGRETQPAGTKQLYGVPVTQFKRTDRLLPKTPGSEIHAVLQQSRCVVRGYSEHHDDCDGTLMPNNEVALVYARHIIRELKEAGGYNDPALTMIVRNAAGATVFSIPFLQH